MDDQGRDRPEVEITPEMIEAAWGILDDYDHDCSDAAKCLVDIFTAMEMARVPSTKLEEINK